MAVGDRLYGRCRSFAWPFEFDVLYGRLISFALPLDIGCIAVGDRLYGR